MSPIRHEAPTWLEAIAQERAAAVADSYRVGLHYGHRLAEHDPLVDHERSLRFEADLTQTAKPNVRARALGELRGYRQATDRP